MVKMINPVVSTTDQQKIDVDQEDTLLHKHSFINVTEIEAVSDNYKETASDTFGMLYIS